jgi:tetratricopeptide (TPR) repeat protein/predicted aspartyl protease
LFNVKINGQPATFILDSGAFFSMMSTAAAEQYKLKTEATPIELTVQGIGGSTTPRLTHIKSFELAGFPIRNVEFLVGGSDVGGGTGALGLVGQNFLEKWDVEYNFGQGNIRLMRNEDCGRSNLAYWVTPDQSYSVIRIAMTTPLEPHAIGTAFVNGVKIKVMFDTGAATSMLSLKAAARAGVTPESAGVIDAGYSSGIGRGTIKSYIATFASLKFGDPNDQGEEIRHARLRFADIGIGEADMLIGTDFFLSHRILVANSQRLLYFSYNGGSVFNLSTSAAKSSPDAASQKPTVQASAAAAPAGDPTAPTDAAVPSADARAQPTTGAGAQLPAAAQTTTEAGPQPSDAAAFARRGAALAGRRDFEHAIADLSKAIELDSKNAEYFYQRATVYWEDRKPTQAITDLDQVLALQPDHVAALVGRARLRVVGKDYAGAKSDLESADKFAPQPANVRFEMAQLYADIGEHAAAILQYDAWIDSHADDSRLAAALNGRCRNRAVLGQALKDALADCNKAISRSAKGANGFIFASRGLVHLRLGDYDESIADYDTALRLHPGNEAGLLYGRGIAKIRKNRRSEGEADVAAAVKVVPDIAERFEKIGLVP